MHVGAVTEVRKPSPSPIQSPSICRDLTKPPGGFLRAALVHPASVKTQNTFLPDLHQQPGDGADGNSVCVMLEAGRRPAPPHARTTPLTCPV